MIAKDALAQANLLPFSPSLKSGLLRRQRLSLAAQSAQQAPAGACGGEFFNFSGKFPEGYFLIVKNSFSRPKAEKDGPGLGPGIQRST